MLRTILVGVDEEDYDDAAAYEHNEEEDKNKMAFILTPCWQESGYAAALLLYSSEDLFAMAFMSFWIQPSSKKRLFMPFEKVLQIFQALN